MPTDNGLRSYSSKSPIAIDSELTRLINGLSAKDTSANLSARSKSASLLPRPEHHIYTIGHTHSSDVNPTGKAFPFLKFDIIRCDDVGKQRLDYIDSKESSGTDNQKVTGEVKGL